MINVNSGGNGRASGNGAYVYCFHRLGLGIIEMMPLATLVGVMFVVVIGTFEWSSIKALGKIPRDDAFVIVLVSVVTVFSDLAVRSLQVIVSCLFLHGKSLKG